MLQDVSINLKTNTQNSKKTNSFRILKYIKLQHLFVGVFFMLNLSVPNVLLHLLKRIMALLNPQNVQV
jgi:hypothetical protein